MVVVEYRISSSWQGINYMGMILTCQKGDDEDIRELETDNISICGEKSHIYVSFDETMYYTTLNNLTHIDVA
tara:strand:+ start:106 stop:321 length:216 start_codon:yes stop_codon:yes gene_type:complete